MKQINLITFAFIAILLLSSCKTETQKEVERTSITPELTSDSIYTRMPGRLFKIDKYAVWEDPFGSADGFMHIIDTETKKEVGTMGRKGQGPKEFSTPSVGKGGGNSLLVYDLNTKKQAIFSLDNFLANDDYFIQLEDVAEELPSSKIQLDNKAIVTLNPAEPFLFKMERDESILEFGDPYFYSEIDNAYDLYQGAIAYNSNRNYFVYTSYRIDYMEIYDMTGRIPSYVYTSEIPSDAFHIEGKLGRTNKERKGAMDLALLKDYIVTIQRDYEVDKTDESTVDMDFEKLPTTLFLYNYKGELQKIVDVGMPIFRIAGDIESNDLFAFGVDPEFVLVKCEL